MNLKVRALRKYLENENDVTYGVHPKRMLMIKNPQGILSSINFTLLEEDQVQ